MFIHSLSPIGEKALQERTAALIGLSIRNSYFKEDGLQELISWANDHFEHIFLMLPDVPAISTLRSLGYDESKAKSVAMLKCNNLENKCQRIIDSLGIGDKARVIRWRDVQDNNSYNAMLSDLKSIYKNNQMFQNDVRETTLEVIFNNETTLSEKEAVDIGVDFILQELGCILNAADIFQVPSCAYVYHREMPVHVNILNKKYPFTPPENTGYIICETDFSVKNKLN